MIFSTPTQFAVLALCLIAGWLFGRAGGNRGRAERERLRAVEAEHAAYRKEQDARIRTLEAERDRLAKVTPVAAPASVAAGTAAAPVAAAEARPARTGLFGGGTRDNLSRIRGVDERTEHALHAEGINSFAQVEALTRDQETTLEDRLGLGRGQIAEQQWREQAAMLREGRDDDHGRRWGILNR
jgi:predicted flap endonuclease-1-like 5' DNA nuclease